MRVELGAQVVSSDGHDVGAVRHLVLDSESRAVRHLVVEKGLLFPRDVELPLEAVRDVADGRIEIGLTADQIRALPEYDPTRYRAVPEEDATLLGYRFGGLLWPAPMPITGTSYGMAPIPVSPAADLNASGEVAHELAAPTDEATGRLLDTANAVIERGSQVYSADNELVGRVDGLTFEAGSGAPTRLLVKRGVLFTTDIELPGSAIRGVDDGVVYLTLDRTALEKLADEGPEIVF